MSVPEGRVSEKHVATTLGHQRWVNQAIRRNKSPFRHKAPPWEIVILNLQKPDVNKTVRYRLFAYIVNNR